MEENSNPFDGLRLSEIDEAIRLRDQAQTQGAAPSAAPAVPEATPAMPVEAQAPPVDAAVQPQDQTVPEWVTAASGQQAPATAPAPEMTEAEQMRANVAHIAAGIINPFTYEGNIDDLANKGLEALGTDFRIQKSENEIARQNGNGVVEKYITKPGFEALRRLPENIINAVIDTSNAVVSLATGDTIAIPNLSVVDRDHMEEGAQSVMVDIYEFMGGLGIMSGAVKALGIAGKGAQVEAKLSGALGTSKLGQGIGKALGWVAVSGTEAAVIDYTALDAHRDRLADTLARLPMASKLPILEYLRSDPDDSNATMRFKNAVEGLVVGGHVAGVMKTVGGLGKAVINYYSRGAAAGEHALEGATRQLVEEGAEALEGAAARRAVDGGEEAAVDAAGAVPTKINYELVIPERAKQMLANTKTAVDDLVGGLQHGANSIESLFDNVVNKIGDVGDAAINHSVYPVGAARDIAELMGAAIKKMGPVTDKETLRNAAHVSAEFIDGDADRLLIAMAKSDDIAAEHIGLALATRGSSVRMYNRLQTHNYDVLNLGLDDQIDVLLDIQRATDMNGVLGYLNSNAGRQLRNIQLGGHAQYDAVATGLERAPQDADGAVTKLLHPDLRGARTAADFTLEEKQAIINQLGEGNAAIGTQRLQNLVVALRAAQGDTKAVRQVLTRLHEVAQGKTESHLGTFLDTAAQYSYNNMLIRTTSIFKNLVSGTLQNVLTPARIAWTGAKEGDAEVADFGVRLMFNYFHQLTNKSNYAAMWHAFKTGETTALAAARPFEMGKGSPIADMFTDAAEAWKRGDIWTSAKGYMDASHEIIFKRVGEMSHSAPMNFNASVAARTNLYTRFELAGERMGLAGKELENYAVSKTEQAMAGGVILDKDALRYAQNVTLTNDINKDFALSPLISGINKMKNTDNPVVRNIFKYLFPFTKIPTNDYIDAVQHLPIIGLSMKRTQQAIVDGGAWERANALGKHSLGIGTLTLGGILYSAGHLHGGYSSDAGTKDAEMRSGYVPYSVKLGDTWVGMNHLGSVGKLLGFVADMSHALHNAAEDPDRTEYLSAFMGAAGHAFSNINAFSDGLKALAIISDTDSKEFSNGRKALSLIQDWTARSIPLGPIVNATESFDPYQRDTSTPDPDNGVWDELGLVYRKYAANVPGLSNTLPLKRSWIDGQPLMKAHHAGVAGINLPVKLGGTVDDPVLNELVKLQPGNIRPSRTIAPGVSLNAEQYSRLCELMGTTTANGRTLKESLGALISSPQYDQERIAHPSDYDEQGRSPRELMVGRVVTAYKDRAVSLLMREHPELQQKLIGQKTINAGIKRGNDTAIERGKSIRGLADF